jgi:hypothetical protein
LRQEGVPLTSGQAIEEVLSPLVLSKRRLAGKALDWIMGSNDPDTLVKKAFEDYQKYAPPAKRPMPLNVRNKFNIDAENLRQQNSLPAMGETGEPSIGDLKYRNPDD